MTRIPPQPPTAATPQARVPFPPGTVLAKMPREAAGAGNTLTPLEQEAMDKAGLRPGDPLPDLSKSSLARSVQQQIESVRQQAYPRPDESPVPPGASAVEIRNVTDISNATPRQQAELVAAMEEARRMQQERTAAELPEHLARIPGMTDAMQQASQAPPAIQVTGLNDLKSFDPTVKPAAPAPAPITTPAAPAAAEPVTQAASAGGDVSETPTSCARCGYMHGMQLTQPTDDDTVGFVVAVLAGQRFYKTYSAFQNHMGFTFRTLLPSESDTIIKQLACDSHRKIFRTVGEYQQRQADYRLAVGLEKFTRVPYTDAAPVVTTMLPLGSLEFSPTDAEPTVLPQLVQYINDRLFGSESARRVVGQEWARFERVVETLEARATNPDFSMPAMPV